MFDTLSANPHERVFTAQKALFLAKLEAGRRLSALATTSRSPASRPFPLTGCRK